MNEDRVPSPGLFRAALLALGGIQAFLGAYALLAPVSFYEDFPLGRGWVAALPSYSEHLVRDVGGLFLLSAAVLIYAGMRLERRIVTLALGAFLLFSVPHTTFHFFNFEPYETGDVIANVIGLGSQVVIPVALLIWMRRPGEAEAVAAPVAAASPAAGQRGRIAPVPDSSRNPLVRYAFRESRKHGAGEVMDPVRVFAHNPTVMLGYGMFEMATERSTRVPERIKHLALMRAATLAGCEWCLDYGSAVAAANDVPDEDLAALHAFEESDRFDELEKLVLRYATGMSVTPVEVPDELFDRLREHFDEAQLVELTNIIALENYRARFNWAFGLAGQGYAEGARCAVPVAVTA